LDLVLSSQTKFTAGLGRDSQRASSRPHKAEQSQSHVSWRKTSSGDAIRKTFRRKMVAGIYDSLMDTGMKTH
jgi:hypothetical protein